MKKILCLGFLALVGCSAVTDISRIQTAATIDGGEKPIAAITVQNVSYLLFGCIPLESGTTWKGECPYDQRPEGNMTWFTDSVSPEDNLASLKAALKEVGSNRVVNLVERAEHRSAWSLWIVKQRLETTTCTVVK